MIWLKTSHAVCRIMSKLYPSFFETVNNAFEKVRELSVPNDFLKCIYQISKEFRIRNALLQKFPQTDMIFLSEWLLTDVCQ